MDVSKLYDATAKSYDELYRDEQFEKYGHVFEKIGIHTGKHVLDVGCGTGLLIEFLKNRGKDVFETYICLDPSIEMLKRAKNKISDPRVIFINSYGEDFAAPSGAFDSIYLFTVWDNVEKKKELVMNIEEMSEKGGHIVITVIPPAKKHCTDDRGPVLLSGKYRLAGKARDHVYIYFKT